MAGRSFLALLTFILAVVLQASNVPDTHSTKSPFQLRVTALVPDENNNTKMQCWQLDNLFQTVPSQKGAAIVNLADFVNGTYTFVPPHSFMGAHNAPYYQ